MTTFVLVHGVWHGGWCYKRVARLLRQAGHEVYTPTLTGLGERADLMNREIDLDTHIKDIVSVIRCEESSDVVLCGHSYGGMVITGAAEQIAAQFGARFKDDRGWQFVSFSCRHDVMMDHLRNLPPRSSPPLREARAWCLVATRIGARPDCFFHAQCSRRARSTVTRGWGSGPTP